MRMIAPGIIFPSEEDTDNRKLSFLGDNVNSYSFSFHFNEWLSFWLFLVASSYFLLSKQVNYFRVRKPQEKVYLSNTTSISNKISENNVYSEISDLDKASYMDSLLSLEEEDSEYWLSDSMSENPSSPLSYISADSFTDISDLDSPSYRDSLLRLEQMEEKNETLFGKSEDRASYMDSLLSLEEEDSEYWLSDSNPSSPLSYISADSFTDTSDFDSPSYWNSLLRLEQMEEKNETPFGKSEDRASYMDSLFSLEEKDSEYWLSDSMSENPSSPLSYISADSFTDISEIDSPSYWDSLLKLEQSEENGTHFGKSEDRASYMDSLLCLEEEDSEYWLSDSMSENPSSPISYISTDSFTDISDIDSTSYWDSLLKLEQSEENGTHFGKSEDNINKSAEHLLETTDLEEYFTAADEHEPLFWPYEGKFNWDSEVSSFCTSPRRSLDSNSNFKYAFEREFFALGQIETLVGLKEFDGHEGLDSEFDGDIFVLEESL